MSEDNDTSVGCDFCMTNKRFADLSRWERALSHACYWLALKWPDSAYWSWPHRKILPWAGNFAFTCHCPFSADTPISPIDERPDTSSSTREGRA